jgi:hypothetical protein
MAHQHARRLWDPEAGSARGIRPHPVILSLLSLALLSSALASPAGAAVWSRTFGGSGQDEARAVEQTTDGGYIVAGKTGSFGGGGDDGWILKLDSLGNIQWQKTFGGTFNDEFTSVQQLAGGDYIVAGHTESFGAGGAGAGDLWLIRLSSAGAVLWQRTYGGSCIDIAHSVRELSGGGLIVAGSTCSFGFVGSGDAWLLHLDPNGAVNAFDNTYGFAAQSDEGQDVWEDPNGFVIAGFTDAFSLPGPIADNDFWILRTDAVGTVLWQFHTGGTVSGLSGDASRAVQQTSDGGWVVTGSTVLGAGSFDFWVIKLSATGTIQWQKTYGFVGSLEDARSIQQTSDGGYIVGGYTSFGSAVDAVLIKLDGSGNLQWQRRYAPGGATRANAVRQTADGGYVTAGFSDAGTPGFNNLWVMKTDGSGQVAPNCIGSTATGTLGTSAAGALPTLATGSPSTVTPAVSTATGPSSSAAVAQTCPANVQVNQDLTLFAQEEVSTAVDPNTSLKQVVVYMDDPDPNTPSPVSFPSIGASFTTDGGQTWADRQLQYGCDLADNDLDGSTDEEIACDGLDDDGDTLVDEDPCCAFLHIDPSVGVDDQGTFFANFIAYDPQAASFQGSSFVVTHRSSNGGNTWTQLPITVASPYGPDLLPPPGADPAPFLDKPWIAVDKDPVSPAAGTAYVGYQLDSPVALANTSVWMTSLPRGGSTWSTPVQMNDLAPGECDGIDIDGDLRIDEEICDLVDNDSDGQTDEDICCQCAEGPIPRLSPGNLWVLWRQNARFCDPVNLQTNFFVDVSTDGGLTFNGSGVPDMPGPTYTQIPLFLRNHSFRTPGFPSFAVDPTNPVVLYAVFPANPGGMGTPDQSDIMFTKSLNGGMNWETPVRVNNDATSTPQYMPQIVTQANANAWTIVDVIWYGERNSIGCDGIDNDIPPDSRIDEELPDGIDNDLDGLTDEDICDIRIDVYTARSVNTPSIPSVFTPNRRVTTTSFLAPSVTFPNFLGDYIGLASDRDNRYAAWTDTRNGQNDVFSDVILDQDSDGDLELDGTDCSPVDPTTKLKPVVVANLTPAPDPNNAANTILSWTSQDPPAGTATRYDIVTGLLSQLNSDGDYRQSTCLVNDHPDTPYTDTRGNPPAGDAFYYVIRAMNPCGSGSYGQTGPSDPRTGLEDGSATLPNPDPCP